MATNDGVPWIVDDLGAAVEVGRQDECLAFRERHHRFGFRPPRVAVRVITVIEVWEIPIGVDSRISAAGGSVGTDGAGHRVVSTKVGAVRVGEGIDPDLGFVHQGRDLGTTAITSHEMVNEPQHQDEARGFIAVHRRGEQDLGFVLLFAWPVGDDQRPQSVRVNKVRARPEVHQPTERGVINRELV